MYIIKHLGRIESEIIRRDADSLALEKGVSESEKWDKALVCELESAGSL